MKILVVGSGGREHAIIQALWRNPEVTEIFALPGNGGMTKGTVCVPIAATDLDGVTDFAMREGIDFAVVAPDDPLCLGLVDRLEEAGVPAFGPRKNAAAIEGSKIFAKDLMRRYHIPTAEYEVFDNLQEALGYLENGISFPRVVKADGLALGKGVFICENREEAEAALRGLMEARLFGQSGSRVVVEEFLTGPEVSVLAFTDGETIVPMVSSMDHKRALDGDRGPNTGGMGAVAPNPFYTPEIAKICMDTIFLPTIRAMKAEGRVFQGCLFFGLMLTNNGPKVIEYNCRFGDPETQTVLPLLKSDLLTILKATRDGTLDRTPVEFSTDSACCVVLASGGYPGWYPTGIPISGLVDGRLPGGGAEVFCAGVKRLEDGSLVTAGGRVLGVTAVAPTLLEAVYEAYRTAGELFFEGMQLRTDIGRYALSLTKVDETTGRTDPADKD